eukprot:357808-Chlamydomonas_euryale.AAC.2
MAAGGHSSHAPLPGRHRRKRRLRAPRTLRHRRCALRRRLVAPPRRAVPPTAACVQGVPVGLHMLPAAHASLGGTLRSYGPVASGRERSRGDTRQRPSHGARSATRSGTASLKAGREGVEWPRNGDCPGWWRACAFAPCDQ